MRKEYRRDWLEGIVSRYQIGGPIHKHFLFPSGFEDTNYFVEVENGRYVIKIFENEHLPKESRRFEVEAMDASYRVGVKTPRVLRNTNGEFVTEVDNKLSILMDYVEGTNMEKKELSDELVREIGEEVGKMDTAFGIFTDTAPAHKDLPFDLRNFPTLEPSIQELPGKYDKALFRQTFAMFRSVQTLFESMPSGVIHHDIDLHNTLSKDGRLAALIDFSDVVFAPYVQNVAVAICHLAFGYNYKPYQAGIFLAAYRRYHPFSPEEEGLLFELACARYAALILEMNNRNLREGAHASRTEYMHDRHAALIRILSSGRASFQAALHL